MIKNKKVFYISLAIILVVIGIIIVAFIINNKNNTGKNNVANNSFLNSTTKMQNFEELNFKLPDNYGLYSESAAKVTYGGSHEDTAIVLSISTEKLNYDSIPTLLKKEGNPEEEIKQETINNHTWYKLTYRTYGSRVYEYTTEKNGTVYRVSISADEELDKSIIEKDANLVASSLNFKD